MICACNPQRALRGCPTVTCMTQLIARWMTVLSTCSARLLSLAACPHYLQQCHCWASRCSLLDQVEKPRTALAYKFKANADGVIDLRSALQAAELSYGRISKTGCAGCSCAALLPALCHGACVMSDFCTGVALITWLSQAEAPAPNAGQYVLPTLQCRARQHQRR